MKQIAIHTEFIRLDAFLKFTGEAGTGGEAKQLISAGQIQVNGVPCLQRGKKLHPGDIVKTVGDTEYTVTREEA